MNISFPIASSCKKQWTPSAIECLQNHCVCGHCDLWDRVYNCHMKETVLEIYKKCGKPEEYEEPTILSEEI